MFNIDSNSLNNLSDIWQERFICVKYDVTLISWMCNMEEILTFKFPQVVHKHASSVVFSWKNGTLFKDKRTTFENQLRYDEVTAVTWSSTLYLWDVVNIYHSYNIINEQSTTHQQQLTVKYLLFVINDWFFNINKKLDYLFCHVTFNRISVDI